MLTETRIAKLIKESEGGTFIGITEGMEWKVIPKPFSSNKDLKLGDYVNCYVLSDDSEFYLEEIPHDGLKSKEEWEEQEVVYG